MQRLSQKIDDGLVHLLFTDAADGDFRVDRDEVELDKLRSGLNPLPWTWLRQVHGARILEVNSAGELAGESADGVLTNQGSVPLSIATADCAPLALIGSNGFALVHAGWRGVKAGIIAKAAKSLVARGAKPVASILGPCISPHSYEFGEPELSAMANEFGSEVRSQTVDGKPALDLTAAVMAACEGGGWPLPNESPCTSDERWFSHRVRGDRGRQVALGWIERE